LLLAVYGSQSMAINPNLTFVHDSRFSHDAMNVPRPLATDYGREHTGHNYIPPTHLHYSLHGQH
jgi:hypothetical protein